MTNKDFKLKLEENLREGTIKAIEKTLGEILFTEQFNKYSKIFLDNMMKDDFFKNQKVKIIKGKKRKIKKHHS